MNQGEKIKRMLDSAGLTPYDIADDLDMSVPGIYKILKQETVKPFKYNEIIEAIKKTVK